MKQNALHLFFNQRRFDLIFKYLYLKYQDNDFVKEAYLDNIRAFNDFYEVEPSDGVAKNSAADFLRSFDNLYISIKQSGFNKNLGIIPVGDNGEISDGAHRLAVCAYLNMEIETESDGRQDLYDYKFFKNREMTPEIMDFGALEYVKLNPNAYIVNLHSITNPAKDTQVIQVLEKYGFIYYQKEINLTFNGYVNLKKLSYGSFWEEEKWIGTVENKFAGAQMHAKNSIGKHPLRVFVFVCDELQKVKKAKEEIRAIFNIGNFSVHINDSREEAIELAETYFNRNSLEMINRRSFIYEDFGFDKRIDELKETAIANKVKLENICAAGSTPFNVFGLRKSSDLDFLYYGNPPFDVQTENLSNHDTELIYYPYPKKMIIQNPKYHFYYHGLKFITLNVLYEMKKKRHEIPKDINDCRMIKNFQRKNLVSFLPHFKIFEKHKNGNKRKIILFGFIKINYKKRRKK